ncbi:MULTISPECIES: hypothetical protein [unclassified Halorhodospira]|nr:MULTISPECIES: hypothetical protein [unclassified Halorhodospira]MBK5937177.1 hypothetical protein [Halorhodospira halophila]MCG5540267.1 hypothetical protein [Halorhodospira sp. M39old]MCG5545805.1 hypothetical protein [Halorhodospira sp. M38]
MNPAKPEISFRELGERQEQERQRLEELLRHGSREELRAEMQRRRAQIGAVAWNPGGRFAP